MQTLSDVVDQRDEDEATIVARWTRLKGDTEWFAEWFADITKDAECLARAAYNGYVEHGEQGSNEALQLSDLLMLGRLLGLVEQRLKSVTDDARRLRQFIDSEVMQLAR